MHIRPYPAAGHKLASLRALTPDEYGCVCAWAIAEQWSGLRKGSVLRSEEFSDILGLPGHSSFAMSEGEDAPVIGFGQIWQSPNGRSNLVRILIDPGLRGRGHGKQLCALLLAKALALATDREVYLRVRSDNLPAIAVYRSLGFRDLEAESHPHVLVMVLVAPACVAGTVPILE
ncbi:GNAT family N-acetyltransferase [Paucibacter soli]|uniref:GNAT family N-acetyltransferase n=1 Tax=Paucibacter soli TaxID=3133433 RepID=UPI003095A3A4